MEIEVRPGLVSKDSEGKLTCKPIFSRIVSLFAEQNSLEFAVPGGLIGRLVVIRGKFSAKFNFGACNLCLICALCALKSQNSRSLHFPAVWKTILGVSAEMIVLLHPERYRDLS